MRSTPAGPRWTGEVRFVEEALTLPLRWKKPRRIFVNSMSDLFHEKVEDRWIDAIFAVMSQSPQHTFQVLTKRPARMLAYFQTEYREDRVEEVALQYFPEWCHANTEGRWPLPNVWLGVSVEDQDTFLLRWPLLAQTPAAMRFISYEPALAGIDFNPHLGPCLACGKRGDVPAINCRLHRPSPDWLIVGGESGPDARPFDLAWARQTIAQGRAAGVPVFVKQLGARPIDTSLRDVLCNRHRHYTRQTDDPFIADCEAQIADGRAPGYSVVPHRLLLRDRKGGDQLEWPEGLRVREFPA